SPVGTHPREGGAVSSGHSLARRRHRAQCVLRPFLRAMNVKYFQETDTLYIEFRVSGIAETKDLDENTQLDVDAELTSALSQSNMRVSVPTSSTSRLNRSDPELIPDPPPDSVFVVTAYQLGANAQRALRRRRRRRR